MNTSNNPVGYVYPDGSKSISRPSDGQVFVIWDKNQQVQSVWQWDDFMEKWVNAGQNAKTSIENSLLEIKPTKLVSECECGKEKHGFASHSNWCPKNQ